MLFQPTLPLKHRYTLFQRKPLPPIWQDIKNDAALRRKLKQIHKSQRFAIGAYVGSWKQSPSQRLHHRLRLKMTGRLNAWSQVNIKPAMIGIASHQEFVSWRRDLNALIEMIQHKGWDPVCEEQSYQMRAAQSVMWQAEITLKQASIIDWLNGDRRRAKQDWGKASARCAALEAQGEKLRILSRYYAPPSHLRVR